MSEDKAQLDKQESPQLLPCPFCGVVPTRRDNVYRYGSIAEHPEGSYCPLANTTIGISAWNTRARIPSGGVATVGRDWSVGDVIAAYPNGTIVLDDGITTWNDVRAVEFFKRTAAFDAYNQAIEDAKAAIREDSQGGGYWTATFINAIARKCSPHVYVNRLAATAPIAASDKLVCDCHWSSVQEMHDDYVEMERQLHELKQATHPLAALDDRPHCWHCGIELEPVELRQRCDECSADCDVEGCNAFGCAPRSTK